MNSSASMDFSQGYSLYILLRPSISILIVRFRRHSLFYKTMKLIPGNKDFSRTLYLYIHVTQDITYNEGKHTKQVAFSSERNDKIIRPFIRIKDNSITWNSEKFSLGFDRLIIWPSNCQRLIMFSIIPAKFDQNVPKLVSFYFNIVNN